MAISNWGYHSWRAGRPRCCEDSAIGWTLSGPLQYDMSSTTCRVAHVNIVAKDEPLACDVQRLWDLETLGTQPVDEVHEEFVDNISFSEGKYSVKLPWKESHDNLTSNYEMCISRLKGQVKKLKHDPALLNEYDAIIQQQLSSGVIEKVAKLESAEKVHYLPHLAVVRKDAVTTKLRIVYDASAKSGGKKSASLNECLHVGPSLNPLLFDILVRFRQKRVALIADIEKAFLNIEVDKADRDCLRFLWLKDAKNASSEVEVYRFCRVVFGLNSSPFLLNATLRYHFSKYKGLDPKFVETMIESFYVDDMVTGDEKSELAYDLYLKAKTRLTEGGFKLRKWKTNDDGLRARVGNRNIATKQRGRK
ncbi:uncharacterized protein LOC114541899 [Dendronephthya gigantea]|uniref:uncharacterized protein LOC114541899 n=1 Tax=Dendronephthya gigantea TaxID=151771 RepID=UPI00106A2324|nr:uncharacterized protein LOC114541899 [Dendronephthya gigantea]